MKSKSQRPQRSITKKNVAEEFDAKLVKIIRGVGGVGRSVVLWLDTCRVLGHGEDCWVQRGATAPSA